MRTACLSLGRIHLHDLREAQDAVHRRAKLMAHARQEVAFGRIGPLGFFLGDAHLAMRVLELRCPFRNAQFQLVVGLAQGRLGLLDRRDVVRDAVPQILVGRAHPPQPFVGAVPADIAVLEPT